MIKFLPSRPALCALGATLTAAFMLTGCPGPSEPGIVEPTATAPAPTPSVCKASNDWITKPTMPSEVAASESFCDFYQFSWQWFLAQVSPSNASDPNSERVFETNRLHDPKVSSGQCAMKAVTGRANAIKLLAVRDMKPHDFEEEQADGSALYDQNGNILYYSIWYSQEECDSTTSGPNQAFAPGTMEIKVSWKVLAKPDPTFFMMDAEVPTGDLVIGGKPTGTMRKVTLGLVGFHLVNWTSKHPEMIWATFEHKANAPLCDGSSTAPASSWSLASSAAAQCLTSNPQSSAGPPNAACASFNFNTPVNFSGNPSAIGAPNQICRQYANGNQPGTSVNGNDNAANLLAIQELNTALNGPKGLLTQLAPTDPMAIWQYYEMIGGIWTKGGVDSCNPALEACNEPVPYTVNGVLTAGDPTSLQRGSLELTNMTMETFEQGDTSEVPNCFGCHNYYSEAPLGVSHIASSLFPATATLRRAKFPEAAPAAAPAQK